MSDKICFVIMPFSDPDSPEDNRWTDLFDSIIRPAVEESGLGYQCYRSLNPAGSFMHDITKHLATAEVAIAVITGLRPNVMYELGARSALKGRTIMLVQDGMPIPSDLSAYIALKYSTNTEAGRNRLRDTIRNRLRDLDLSAPTSDNPVHDNLVLFVTSFMKDWYENENPEKFRARLERLLPDFVLMLEHVWRRIGGRTPATQVASEDDRPSPIHAGSEREAARQASLIWTNRGTELKDRHELALALQCFDAALEIDPENLTALASRSLVLVMLQRTDEARESVRRVFDRQPGKAPDWNATGKALLARREFRKAADAFARAFGLDDASAIYANNAGFAWELAGEPGQAEDFYRKALALNAQFAHALYNLGKLLRRLGRDADGSALMQRAMEVDSLIGEEVETQRAALAAGPGR